MCVGGGGGVKIQRLHAAQARAQSSRALRPAVGRQAANR